MDNRILVSALAITIVASRLLHKRLRTTTFRRLEKGQTDLLFAKTFEIPGKLEKLSGAARNDVVPWKLKPHLLRHETKGKVALFEAVSAVRKSRRYYAIRQKGPLLQVTAIPATSDLANSLTLGLMAAAIGVFAQTGLPFVFALWTGLLADLAFRASLRASSARKELAGFLA